MARPANRSLAMYAISVPKCCCCLRCSLILEPGTMCLGIEAWHCMQYRCPGGVCLQLRCRRPQRGRRLRRAQPIEAWHCTQMLCPGAAAAYGAARYWSRAPCASSSAAVAPGAASQSKLGAVCKYCAQALLLPTPQPDTGARHRVPLVLLPSPTARPVNRSLGTRHLADA